MSDKTVVRGVYYLDVVAALLALLILLGHFFTRNSPASPAVARDGPGFWIPLSAVMLLILSRRRAYTQERPWIVLACAAMAFGGIAAVFWRGDLMVFMAAIGGALLLLLAGFSLRSRRIAEPLSRPDLYSLILLVGGVCIGVALTEVFVRLASGLFDEEIQQVLQGTDPRNLGVAHSYIGHLHTPNSTMVVSGRDFHAIHRIDALGFRNRWPWPDQADVVAVGDSVTFGHGVQDDEAWPHLVGQHLSPRRLINLGLIGAGPQQYQRAFETFGVKLRPKLLLVGLFAWNDFSNAEEFDRWLQSGKGGNYMVWRNFGQAQPLRLRLWDPLETLEGFWRSVAVPMLRRSYMYTLLQAYRDNLGGEAPPRIYRFGNGSRVQLFESMLRFRALAVRPGRREFRLTVRALEQIHLLAAKQGTRVLIVLLPGKEEVYLPLLGETTPDLTGALRPALDALGIEYLNLMPGFRASAAAGEQLFFEVDGHPNRAGQALIAHLVQEHIAANAGRYGLAE